jgi:hypothetical protein
MRFQVLTAASLKMAVFWDVAPCSLVEGVSQQTPLKSRLTSSRLHGATTQKTAIFRLHCALSRIYLLCFSVL